LIADDALLIKIVTIWSYLNIKQLNRLKPLTGTTENDIWEWLWANTVFDVKEIKTKIDFHYPESILKNKIQQLIGNRIIFPDGTINSFVQKYLRERVLKLFDSKTNSRK